MTASGALDPLSKSLSGGVSDNEDETESDEEGGSDTEDESENDGMTHFVSMTHNL